MLPFNAPGTRARWPMSSRPKLESLKTLYNSKWWDASQNHYFAALSEDGQFHPDLKASTGRTDIQFPLYFGLTDGGHKTQASLDQLEKRLDWIARRWGELSEESKAERTCPISSTSMGAPSQGTRSWWR